MPLSCASRRPPADLALARLRQAAGRQLPPHSEIDALLSQAPGSAPASCSITSKQRAAAAAARRRADPAGRRARSRAPTSTPSSSGA